MKISSRIGLIAVLGIFAAASAYPAGYEKATMWSGHYAALGGAASSVVSGSQSLFFNPAGLASGNSIEVSGNFSPTWSKFSGPFLGSTVVDGNTKFSPIAAVTASIRPLENLGVGIGYAVTGGDISNYSSIDYSGFPGAGAFAVFKPNAKLDLRITELSIGAGYELIPGLRLGAAWRIAFVHADMASPSILPGALGSFTLSEIDLNGLSDTRYNGFRFGAQYAPQDAKWGVGAHMRTGLTFTAKGTSSGTAYNSLAGAVPVTGGSAQASSDFPMQISAGGFYWFLPKTFRLIGEYTFTRYAVDRSVDLQGPISVGGTPLDLSIGNIAQHWHNMHNFRIAAEYMTPMNWVARAGYVLTSQVTPNDLARPTFASPGKGHTIAVGIGYPLMSAMTADGALEYSFASGSGTYTAGAAKGTGDFSSHAYAAHLGLTYGF